MMVHVKPEITAEFILNVSACEKEDTTCQEILEEVLVEIRSSARSGAFGCTFKGLKASDCISKELQRRGFLIRRKSSEEVIVFWEE